MNLHLGYPTVTKGHNLTRVTLIAKPTKAHRHPTYSQTKNNAHRLLTCSIPRNQTTQT
jgi:hypothetical protein